MLLVLSIFEILIPHSSLVILLNPVHNENRLYAELTCAKLIWFGNKIVVSSSDEELNLNIVLLNK